MILIFFLIIAYLVGSIPTGYLFCRYVFDLDITQHGSGNIGATNVARTLGSKKYFVFILLIDTTKAFLTLYICGHFLYFSYLELITIALTMLIGNAHSIFLKFKGGKGVATTLGIILYMLPFYGTGVFATSWCIVLALTRHVFIASLLSPLITLVTLTFYKNNIDLEIYFLIFIWFWLLIRHKQNLITFIQRKIK